MMATADDLWRAFDDAIAVAREHEDDQGATTIVHKLAVFGIDAEALREVLLERWETYRGQFNPDEPHLLFAQAMTEGLLAGLKMPRD